MNGSKLPPLVDPTSVWYAENVTFRDGVGAHTRPGFKETPTTYWRNDQSNIADLQTIDGKQYTSRDRYIRFVQNGTNFLGAFLYEDPRVGRPVQLLIAVDGLIISLNFSDNACFILNKYTAQGNRQIDTSKSVYFSQAERFAIIQNGFDVPLIFDGYSITKSTDHGDGTNVVPAGKQMAYGQGRLFVAVENGTKIVASDIIFGGSTSAIKIVSIKGAPNGQVEVTTEKAHGIQLDETITISGLIQSSLLNGVYVVSGVPLPSVGALGATKLLIQSTSTITSVGSFGKIIKYNAGADYDILNFTETLYLNEGGYLTIPTQFGQIVTMNFIPTQDTATGQGNLVVLCTRGAVSFAVGLDRTAWGSTAGFQTVLYSNIGATSDSTALVNGDLFFRSLDGNGIRSYRSARAEFDGYGQTPMSAQIDPVLNQDTPYLLDNVSMVYFNDRLLMTCLPKLLVPTATNAQEAEVAASNPGKLIHKGISALDFRSVATIGGAGKPAYDGVWTGLNFVKIFSGHDSTKKRCFALCFNPSSITISLSGSPGFGGGETYNDLYPISGTYIEVEGNYVKKGTSEATNVIFKRRQIGWDGDNPKYGYDLISDNGTGSYICFVRSKDITDKSQWFAPQPPDQYGNHNYAEPLGPTPFSTEYLQVKRNFVKDYSPNNTTGYSIWELDEDLEADFAVSGYRQISSSIITRAYNFSQVMNLKRLLRLDVWFDSIKGGPTRSLTADVAYKPDDWPEWVLWGTTTKTFNTESFDSAAGGTQPYQTLYSGYAPQLRLSGDAAPQIKFPAPADSSGNTMTNLPMPLGYDFTFLLSWTGHARLGRFLSHALQVIENVGC
jgi:hypothetical protein